MKRCKLISPTNLMLEHPILSPVEECEYVLFGVKEYAKDRRDWLIIGLIGGLGIGIALMTVVIVLGYK